MINKTDLLRTSQLEFQFYEHVAQAGLPLPEWQYLVCDHRADFAWPDLHVCVEIQGATHRQGRHTRGAGYAADRMLANRRQVDGWIALEFTSDHLNSNAALPVLRAALERRGL